MEKYLNQSTALSEECQDRRRINMVKKKEITFKDLTWQLKVGIVGGWAYVIALVLSFIVGLFLGTSSAI